MGHSAFSRPTHLNVNHSARGSMHVHTAYANNLKSTRRHGHVAAQNSERKKEQLQPLYHQSISSPPLPVSLSDSGNLNQPMEPQNYLSETPKCTPITNKHVSHYIFFNMHFQFWETSVLPSGKFAFLFCPYHLQTAPYPDIPPSLPPSLGVALLSWGPCPCFPALALPCAWPFRVHITGNLCSQILRSSFLFPPRIAHKVPALCGATRVLFFYFCPGLGFCMCVHNQGAHSTDEKCRTNGSHYATPASTLQARTCFQSPLITNATPKQNQVSNQHYVFKFLFFFACGASVGTSHCPPPFLFLYPGSCPNAHLCSSGERWHQPSVRLTSWNTAELWLHTAFPRAQGNIAG